MPNNDFSYEQYLGLIADSSGIKMQEGSSSIIEKFTVSQNIPTGCALTTFLVDFATKKYIYVDEACFNLFGYTATWMMESGLGEYLKTWHPVDHSIINEKVFRDSMRFLKTLPKEDYADIIFSYNYRVLNPRGEYVTVLQRFSYIPGKESGKPVGMVGVAFDITHFKNDMTIVHTIEKTLSYNNGIVHELLFKKIHPIYEVNAKQLLSKKEIEILHFMSEGYSSKQIASKINLSINTINNHRKNMLCKMHCKTSSELMSYAIKHGLV
jgi:DNA-binding CsgD family transcriptional regulator